MVGIPLCSGIIGREILARAEEGWSPKQSPTSGEGVQVHVDDRRTLFRCILSGGGTSKPGNAHACNPYDSQCVFHRDLLRDLRMRSIDAADYPGDAPPSQAGIP